MVSQLLKSVGRRVLFHFYRKPSLKIGNIVAFSDGANNDVKKIRFIVDHCICAVVFQAKFPSNTFESAVTQESWNMGKPKNR